MPLGNDCRHPSRLQTKPPQIWALTEWFVCNRTERPMCAYCPCLCWNTLYGLSAVLSISSHALLSKMSYAFFTEIKHQMCIWLVSVFGWVPSLPSSSPLLCVSPLSLSDILPTLTVPITWVNHRLSHDIRTHSSFTFLLWRSIFCALFTFLFRSILCIMLIYLHSINSMKSYYTNDQFPRLMTIKNKTMPCAW